MKLYELPFLGEYIKENDIKLECNTMIVAPTGAGKTHMIFTELLNDPTKKYLYLCDNINLTEQTLKEDNTFDFKIGKFIPELEELLEKYEYNEYYLSQDEAKEYEQLKIMRDKGVFNMSIAVMTYAYFGEHFKLQHSEKLKEYDLIVCDEIHNLFLYEKIGKNGNSNLAYAIENLFMRYRDKCIYFSATPQIVTDIKEKGLISPKTMDFYDKVREYNFDLREPYYFDEQIYVNISRLQNYFKNGKKALIYTNSITRMKEIESELTNKYDLNCCCIWSTNESTQKKHPFTQKQIDTRKNLIKYGMFPDDVNVIIINNAMETGINIYDDVQYVIIDSNNPTTRAQIRGRIRHDIVMLSLKSNGSNYEPVKSLEIDDKWLNIPLTTAMKKELVQELQLTDDRGRDMKWTGLKNMLESSGYEVKDTQRRIDNKRVKVSVITKVSPK